MRAALDAWVVRTGDLGAVPEAELAERFWPGGVQPMTPPPTIEPSGGTYAGPIEVAIHSEVPGASLAYTLDEGDPVHWKLYTGPVEVPASGTLRARAVRYGWADSDTASARFDVSSGRSGS